MHIIVYHFLTIVMVHVCKAWTFALLIQANGQCEGLMCGMSDNKEIPRLFLC